MFRLQTIKTLAIFAILLTVPVYIFTGCERITVDNVFQYEDLGFIDTPWEIVSVNGQPFESLFTPEPREGSPPSTYDITSNFVFDAKGKLTGELTFRISEQYPVDPPRSLTYVVTYTVTGEYTAGETTLTIETQNVEIDVAALLTPRDAWEQVIEGITVEQLQDDLVAESEMGFTQDESTFPFTVGANYTQQTEQNTLTLSVPGETVVLRKKTE